MTFRATWWTVVILAAARLAMAQTAPPAAPPATEPAPSAPPALPELPPETPDAPPPPEAPLPGDGAAVSEATETPPPPTADEPVPPSEGSAHGWPEVSPTGEPTEPEPPLPRVRAALEPSFAWHVTTLEGRDYLPARDVAAFYGFERYSRERWAGTFRGVAATMRWETESTFLFINDTKYLLAHPCVLSEGELHISRVDLVKWVDPLLRPEAIPTRRWFDTVVVDPGHGGLDNGTRSSLGDEKAYALDVALRLRDELVQRGLRVVMTREADERREKQERAHLANEVVNAVLVSLHFNQDPTHTVQGLETYAMTPRTLKSSNDTRPGPEAPFGYAGNIRENESLALTTAVHSSILDRCGSVDRGVRRARFAVLKDCELPGVLVEGGYLSHRAEAQRVHNPQFRAALARAIAEGVVRFREALGAGR